MNNIEDLDNEIWVTHPIGIRVSNMGRVETRYKGKYYGSKNGTPYLYVWWDNKMHRVHRLICEAFNDNPHNLPYVNHKDENPRNNRADNLEWCDAKYNTNYGTAIERRVKNTDWKKLIAKRVAHTDWKKLIAKRVAHTDWKAIGEKVAEKLSIPILQLNKDTLEVVKEWKSAMEAERNGGFNNGNISNCLKGRHKTHKGFIWRYKENGEAS